MEFEALKFIGIGLLALGMGGAAIGVGLIFNGAVSGIARNPTAEAQIFRTALLGAALAELMGLLSFALAFVLPGL